MSQLPRNGVQGDPLPQHSPSTNEQVDDLTQQQQQQQQSHNIIESRPHSSNIVRNNGNNNYNDNDDIDEEEGKDDDQSELELRHSTAAKSHKSQNNCIAALHLPSSPLQQQQQSQHGSPNVNNNELHRQLSYFDCTSSQIPQLSRMSTLSQVQSQPLPPVIIAPFNKQHDMKLLPAAPAPCIVNQPIPLKTPQQQQQKDKAAPPPSSAKSRGVVGNTNPASPSMNQSYHIRIMNDDDGNESSVSGITHHQSDLCQQLHSAPLPPTIVLPTKGNNNQQQQQQQTTTTNRIINLHYTVELSPSQQQRTSIFSYAEGNGDDDDDDEKLDNDEQQHQQADNKTSNNNGITWHNSFTKNPQQQQQQVIQEDTKQQQEKEEEEEIIEITPFPTQPASKLYIPLWCIFIAYSLIFFACDTVSSLGATIFSSTGLLSSAMTYIVVICLALIGPIVATMNHPLLLSACIAVIAYSAFIACNFSFSSVIIGGLLSGFGGLGGFLNSMHLLSYSQYVADEDLKRYIRTTRVINNDNDNNNTGNIDDDDLEPTFKTIEECNEYLNQITDRNGRIVRSALLQQNEYYFKRYKLSIDSGIAFGNAIMTMMTNLGSLLGCVMSFFILHYLKEPGEKLTSNSSIIRTLLIVLLCCCLLGNVIFFISFFLLSKESKVVIDIKTVNDRCIEDTLDAPELTKPKTTFTSIWRHIKITCKTVGYLLCTKPILLSLWSIFCAYSSVGFVTGGFVNARVAPKLGTEYVILFSAMISAAGVIISFIFSKFFAVNTPNRARGLFCCGILVNIITLLIIHFLPMENFTQSIAWGIVSVIALLAAIGSCFISTALSAFIAFQCCLPQLRSPAFTLMNVVKSLGLFTTFMLAVYTSFNFQLYILLGALILSCIFQVINFITAWVVDVDQIAMKLDNYTIKLDNNNNNNNNVNDNITQQQTTTTTTTGGILTEDQNLRKSTCTAYSNAFALQNALAIAEEKEQYVEMNQHDNNNNDRNSTRHSCVVTQRISLYGDCYQDYYQQQQQLMNQTHNNNNNTNNKNNGNNIRHTQLRQTMRMSHHHHQQQQQQQRQSHIQDVEMQNRQSVHYNNNNRQTYRLSRHYSNLSGSYNNNNNNNNNYESNNNGLCQSTCHKRRSFVIKGGNNDHNMMNTTVNHIGMNNTIGGGNYYIPVDQPTNSTIIATTTFGNEQHKIEQYQPLNVDIQYEFIIPKVNDHPHHHNINRPQHNNNNNDGGDDDMSAFTSNRASIASYSVISNHHHHHHHKQQHPLPTYTSHFNNPSTIQPIQQQQQQLNNNVQSPVLNIIGDDDNNNHHHHVEDNNNNNNNNQCKKAPIKLNIVNIKKE